MIKVKSEIREDRIGTSTEVSFEGTGEDILNEAVGIISGLMSSLKNDAPDVFYELVGILAEHTSILFGDVKGRVIEERVSNESQHITFKEGVN